MKNTVQLTILLEMMVFDKCIIYLELKLIIKEDFETMIVSACYLLNNPIFSRYRVLLYLLYIETLFSYCTLFFIYCQFYYT